MQFDNIKTNENESVAFMFVFWVPKFNTIPFRIFSDSGLTEKVMMATIVDRVEIGFAEVTSIDVWTKCHNDETTMCSRGGQTNVATMATRGSINVPVLGPDHVPLN